MYDEVFLDSLQGMLTASLTNWGLSPSAQVSLLTISENATFRVIDPSEGRDLILRVHRPDYHTTAEIESELHWIEALRLSGTIRTPAPIPGIDGELLYMLHDGAAPRHVVAFERVAGRSPDTSDDLVAWFGELGAISAQLHLQSRQWRRPENFVRKLWNFDTTVGEMSHWGRWTEGLGLDDAGRALLARTVATIRRHVGNYGDGPDRFGLVHADLRLANLLVDEERLNIIDFDDCGFSWFVYDFAAAVSFIEHEPMIPAMMAAWIEGYRRIMPLSADDAAMIPVFVMLRRILLVAWIASHAETPTAQETGVPYTTGTLILAERFLTDYA